jgi:hypothetical protein
MDPIAGMKPQCADAHAVLHDPSASELVSLNAAYAVQDFVPGLTLIGTNGADTGYGFMMARGILEYVAVPLVGMDPDEVSIMGHTLVEFLSRLVEA